MIPGVRETMILAAAGARPDEPPDLLVEVPHGATREADYEALRRRLFGDFPADLREFFFVNTDVGAPECAVAFARRVVDTASGPRKALVVRGLLPRTFVDCNRVLEREAPAAMTPVIPDYVGDERDRRLLRELHARYTEATSRSFDEVCGRGGTALILHSYAPRSVGIEHIDGSIVERLREEYRPERFERWPLRPPVDVISEAEDGTYLAPRALVAAVRERYGAAGVETAENATYRLHGDTEGYRHSARHPGRVLCVEIRRDLLADPFTPFREMRIGEACVRRMVEPLAAAFLGPSR